MNPTRVFTETSRAYLSEARYIINKGGTRSSKTFSALQLFKLITRSKKSRIITIVSHSLPHLIGGAIRDYNKILIEDGIAPDEVGIKNPYIYTMNKTIIEFIGFDKLGKTLGGTRDILFINEANKMPFTICHQLIQRTSEYIFIDYNPSHEFWIDTEGYLTRNDSIIVHSTFKDNIQNLSQGIIDDLNEAKRKADLEEKNDRVGYWWNWWQVYGLGLKGRLENTILTNWSIGEFNNSLPCGYGLDFGVKHPDGMVKVAVDRNKKKLYWKEEIYQNGLSTNQLYEIIRSREVGNKLIIGDSAAKRTILDLRGKGLNIKAVSKGAILDDIKLLNDYEIIVDPDSINLQRNLSNWCWLDRKGEVPMDEEDDLIDAGRYYTRTIIKPIHTGGVRLL